MYWYDGKLIENNYIELDINNPALLYGATVFTTMRVYHKSLDHPLTNWNSHLNRLKNTLDKFHWQNPHWHKIKEECQELSSHFPVLRITILPDGKELIIGRNLPPDLDLKQQEGIIGWVADESYQRILGKYKTGNYLTSWLALQTAKNIGAQEAILVDENDHWLETSTGNLWGYKQGIWFTPLIGDKILPGITRKTIIENSTFPIQENSWNLEFINSLEAIAYSNCVVELIPFKQIKNGEKELFFNINLDLLEEFKNINSQDSAE